MNDDIIIQTRRLSKRFGDEYAVRDVSFSVTRGTIFGFIGPSGSGKTTTIRMLTGTYRPESGTVEVLGKAPSDFDQKTRARIGYMPQSFVLYPDLTVRENLSFAASIYGVGLRRRNRMNEVLEFVELREHAHKPAKKVSGGMQRRLSLAATMVHDPDLFFLDEPTTGIDPILREKFWDRFRKLTAAGKTLFITTQYVSEASYCDTVGLLAKGKMLTVGTPEALRQQAYGGDLVEVELAEHSTPSFVTALRSLPFVVRVSQESDPHHLRIGVDEAGTDMPQLIKWIEGQGREILFIEEYVPPFDDVFVTLVRRQEMQS